MRSFRCLRSQFRSDVRLSVWDRRDQWSHAGCADSFLHGRNSHRSQEWASCRCHLEVEANAFSSIATPLLILLALGALFGTWNMSSTIPTLAYYSIQPLQPRFFYVATALIAARCLWGPEVH